MSIPATRPLTVVLLSVLDFCNDLKGQADNAVTSMAGGSVNSDFIFRVLDYLKNAVTALNTWKVVSGLDAQATAQLSNYSGTMTSDIAATITAAQACIDWVVTNFPKDSTATFLLSHQLNSDGSRTPRAFSSAQTAGLRTALQALSATMS